MNTKPIKPICSSGLNTEISWESFGDLSTPRFNCLDDLLVKLGCSKEQIEQYKTQLENPEGYTRIPFCEGVWFGLSKIQAKRIKNGTVLYMVTQARQRVSKREAEILAGKTLEKLNALGIFMESQHKGRTGWRGLN